MITPTDPTTPAEWQHAVDLAEVMLAVHSAVAFGLVTGGSAVNVERCEEILRRGADLGYRPADDAIERLLPQYQAEAEGSRTS